MVEIWRAGAANSITRADDAEAEPSGPKLFTAAVIPALRTAIDSR